MLKTLTMPRRKPRQVGPEDRSRRMSLAEFDTPYGKGGFRYELNKGIVEVTNIPHHRHFRQLLGIRVQLIVFQLSNPGVIPLGTCRASRWISNGRSQTRSDFLRQCSSRRNGLI